MDYKSIDGRIKYPLANLAVHVRNKITREIGKDAHSDSSDYMVLKAHPEEEVLCIALKGIQNHVPRLLLTGQ